MLALRPVGCSRGSVSAGGMPALLLTETEATGEITPPRCRDEAPRRGWGSGKERFQEPLLAPFPLDWGGQRRHFKLAEQEFKPAQRG